MDLFNKFLDEREKSISGINKRIDKMREQMDDIILEKKYLLFENEALKREKQDLLEKLKG